MKRIIQILAAVLIVQLILVVIMSATQNRDRGAFVSNEKLLDVDLAAVDQITLEQADKSTLHLKKTGTGWILADRGDFPVARFKFDSAINKLLLVNKSWPVATTDSAAKHFRVADDSFERKITFRNADSVVKTLLLGSAPGFKKIHARVADSNDIHQITYSVFEANADADAWTDKDYLKLTGNPIVRAQLPDSLVLEKLGEQMTVASLMSTEEINQEMIKSLMENLQGISFTSVLGTENKAEYNQDKPVLEYNLELENGDPISYSFSKLGESKDLVLKTSSHPYFFKVMPATVSIIQEAKRHTLVKPTTTPTDNDQIPANAVPAMIDQNKMAQ